MTSLIRMIAGFVAGWRRAGDRHDSPPRRCTVRRTPGAHRCRRVHPERGHDYLRERLTGVGRVGSEELDQASGLAADRRPRRLTANHNTTAVRQQRNSCRRTAAHFNERHSPFAHTSVRNGLVGKDRYGRGRVWPRGRQETSGGRSFRYHPPERRKRHLSLSERFHANSPARICSQSRCLIRPKRLLVQSRE